jgi:hypothetical protein
VEGILKSVGLYYAKGLPVAIGTLAALMVVVAWLAVQARQFTPPYRKAAWIALCALAAVLIVQAPVAYNKAKDECRQQFARAGGHYNFPAQLTPAGYVGSKCAKAWPHGPGAPY